MIAFAIIAAAYLKAQTLDDIGKIVVGVKILSTATEETKANASFLKNKLASIASNAGFTSFGNSTFYLTPSITINEERMAEGGMKNIHVVSGDIFLTIQERETGTVYESTTYPFRGSGTTKESAIKNGLQKITYGDTRPFFDSAKKRILEYYNSKQEMIFANADLLAQNKDYDAAIACLLAIPEELFDTYQKAFSKACAIYKDRDLFLSEQKASKIKDSNNAILVKARSMMAAHEPKQALEVLWDYTITETKQDNEYWQILRQVESRITAEELAALEKERQEYNDRISYRDKRLALEEKELQNNSEMINAVKSVALAYISNNSY